MIKFTEEKLRDASYRIENAKIEDVNLSMADHGCMTLSMTLIANGWGCVYGGYVLGYGYLGSNHFEGTAKGLESIMRIMDVVGVECFNDLKGKYVRVATKGWGNNVYILGNVIEEKWFDQKSFFESDDKVMSNAEKFEEVFGFKPDNNSCPYSSSHCEECKYDDHETLGCCEKFWNAEYKKEEE